MDIDPYKNHMDVVQISLSKTVICIPTPKNIQVLYKRYLWCKLEKPSSEGLDIKI